MNTPLPPVTQRAEAVLSLIGHTPLVPLRCEPEGLTVLAKCEFLNPSGSVKDRLAKGVLLDARARGLLRPDSIILECTSGNTGIALAMTGAALGYRVTQEWPTVSFLRSCAARRWTVKSRCPARRRWPWPGGSIASSGCWGEPAPGRTWWRRSKWRGNSVPKRAW